MSNDPLNLQEILAFAIPLARTSGEMIKRGAQARLEDIASGFEEKKNSVDLVTATDQAVEHFVASELRRRFPSHAFIGEESHSSGSGDRLLTNQPTWILDPIDGTTNFVHGSPMCCVSIGLCHHAFPVLGVVYNPFLDELYSAYQGGGAWLNEIVPLPLQQAARPLVTLQHALIGFDWGTDRSPATMACKLKTFDNLLGSGKGQSMARGMRCTGSAALNFCSVACGQLDMFWEIGCWEWDVCAGAAIALEAGGALFGGRGRALDGIVNGDLLQGRKYLIIRSMPGGLKAQRILASEFLGQVEEWDQ